MAKIESVLTGGQTPLTLEWKNTSGNSQTKLIHKEIKLKSEISVQTYQVHTW